MKLKLKHVAPLATLALALSAPGAHAALVQPGATNGSDLILNIWDADNSNRGYSQDLGVQIGSWNPANPFSITISDPNVVAAFNANAAGTVFNIVAANSNASNTHFYTTVDSNNISNLGAAGGDTNFSLQSAVNQAVVAFGNGGLTGLSGNTFGGPSTTNGTSTTGHSPATSASDGLAFGANMAQGFTNLSNVSSEGFGEATMYFVAYSLGASGPTVSIYAGHWAIDYNVAAGSATLTWTPDAPTVPIPAAVWLLGSALLGVAGVGRRRA